MDRLPLTRDLVLIGGGHAHALVLRMWGMDPLPGVRLTVINPGPVAPYTGMLPGHDRRALSPRRDDDRPGAAGPLRRGAGDPWTAPRASTGRRGGCIWPGRTPVAYDVASIDIGIDSDLPDLPGFADTCRRRQARWAAYADAWEAFVAGGLASAAGWW